MTETPDQGRAPGLFALILSDFRRKQEHYVLVRRFFNRYVKVLFQHGTLAVAAYRFGHWAHTRRWAVTRFFFLLAYRLGTWPARWIGRVYIDPKVPIGPGFVIHNFSGVFIQAERIGANFTINQGVTVGYDHRRQALPTLGDNVFLGAGAKVLGPITLGDGVVVAANCLVEKSVAAHCVVAGVPGIVVQRNTNKDYVGSVAASLRPPTST
jgi:serine O-acetyltransferase